jgi:hypothetical protein
VAYLDETKIDRDLVLEFFLRFARFEFALKASGYADGDDRRVDPAWERFARDITVNFDRQRSMELDSACEYYLLHPPNKQVLVNGSLAWSTALPIDLARETELLIALVRRVRNNLFHGGKYNAALHEETARSEALLRGGLQILEECLRVSGPVRQVYDGATL